jgi:hypothetical protein
MNKKFETFVLAIALCLLIPTENAWAQDDYSLGGFVGDQVAEIYQHLEESRKNCNASSGQVQAARDNYHAALRSGQGIEGARAQLYLLLDTKDFLYIGTYVVSGIDSPQTRLILSNCMVDGGIRPRLSASFMHLVREVRSDMGAKRPNDVVMLFNPQKLVDVIEAQKERANAYVHARNLLEIYESGVPMEQLFSAEAYLKILLEMEYSMPSLSILKPDMDKLPQEHFDLAVELFGKKLVMEAAETVQKLPKDEAGFLVDFFTADQVRGTYKPFDAFNAILKTEPKGFVVFTRQKRWSESWESQVSAGSDYYDDLVNRHGKDRVHEVVKLLRATPRLFAGNVLELDGVGYKAVKDVELLEDLLINPDAQIADDKDFVFLAATDTEAIIKSKGKVQIIYGRVSDVQRADGGGQSTQRRGGTSYVFFAGASKFGVWFTDRDFERSRRFFGSDGQGLIGHLFRGEGYIWPSEIRSENTIQPDWNMRVKDGNFYVLTEEDWPDYLPIPGMEPARSLDELRAAVTPFVIEPIIKGTLEQQLQEAYAMGRGAGPPLMPLNCQEDYRGVAARMHELSPDQNVSGYLVRMQNYAWKVGDYQALNEICTSKLNPAVRGDFLTAAVGGFDEDYSSRLNGAVDARYQPYCRPFYWQCPESILEHAQAEYEKIMTILRSGDLQRGLQRAVVVSTLPADWKRYALTIGQYEVMSEACSGALDAAIRDDFFAAMQIDSADQAAEFDTMIDESYEKYSSALQESIERQPANEERLKCRVKRVKNKYERIINTLAAEETTTATTR